MLCNRNKRGVEDFRSFLYFRTRGRWPHRPLDNLSGECLVCLGIRFGISLGLRKCLPCWPMPIRTRNIPDSHNSRDNRSLSPSLPLLRPARIAPRSRIVKAYVWRGRPVGGGSRVRFNRTSHFRTVAGATVWALLRAIPGAPLGDAIQ